MQIVIIITILILSCSPFTNCISTILGKTFCDHRCFPPATGLICSPCTYNRVMRESLPKQFASPQEEIAYLREQIAQKEREVLSRTSEIDAADSETIAKQELFEYGTFTPNVVLAKGHQLKQEELAASVEQVLSSHNPTEEIVHVAIERGIYNALTVLEKTNNAFTTDEVHRKLIELIKEGRHIGNLKEGVPPWQILHMTLFEIALPEHQDEGREVALSELVSMMEQFYAGMQGIGSDKKKEHYGLEISIAEGSDDIIFYVAVPTAYVDLFEKQTLSLYPNAVITEQKHDYNIFTEGGTGLVSVASLQKFPAYPLKTKDEFESDPLAVLLNAFSKIEKEGSGASLQVLIRKASPSLISSYESIIKRINDGSKTKDAIMRSTLGGEFVLAMKELVSTAKAKEEGVLPTPDIDHDAIELFSEKIATPILEVIIRIAVSAKETARAEKILSEIEATFHQFEKTRSNQLVFKRVTKNALAREIKAYSFREFTESRMLPLSMRELATMIHFPGDGDVTSPQFKQTRAKTAAAPTDMPESGTLLGINVHRGSQKKIFITPEDRLRHFYIIGQTGTGKTTLMKNMIIQDIHDGAGVCLIDPHGTDIEDVLGAIPKDREKDIIYFDPSKQDRVVGLNMLEYDYQKPEQKTFVVNELFSIFQKLYGANPESMGPMFEQYFRNATLLVMEDPESGNTLMDISRVMSDSAYRKLKLAKAKNPVVVQFWQEIATKAGGEASLENVVPYIVSKFDVFTANDYMRPIIGQQHSAFNFREVMDQRKILLVNLSKGRIGEINANLIGMIIVGKLLMAALSRVDDPTKSFPAFYLHMDEFQNISTNSISAILSEARKYKLGLTMAHQFIAQLEESIKDAVFGNVGSMAVFRVGPDDASFLEKQYQPTFDSNDLMNVPNRVAYVRALANGVPTRPFSMATIAPKPTDLAHVQTVINESYAKYGRPRQEIEAEIHERYQKQAPLKKDPFGIM